MKTLFYYLLQMIVASGILYGYYHFVLRNKRFHRYNRFYILLAVLLSVLIPFLNIPVYFTAEETHSSLVIQTLQVISSTSFNESISISLLTEPAKANWFTWQNLSYLLYILVAFTALLRILFSLRKIRSIIRNNQVEKLENIRFVNTDEPGTPFSFFRWLFWNRRIELKSSKGEQVFRHELFHIQQKHSWDILFMEVITIVFWINPFFHLMKKELKAIHEFLADEFAINENEKWQYAELLLMQALNTQVHLTNPFFHNQIKRRIAMITSSSKPSYQYLRKLLVLPIAAIVVGLFAFKYKNQSADPVAKAEKSITVVIDAGHGGNDPGVKSLDGNYTEAQLTLDISKTIQRLSGEYNIDVVMTRENEDFPGDAKNRDEGLRQRLNLANKTSPDAFVAIHMNSTNRNVSQNKLSGIEAYITSKKENNDEQLLASTVLQELATIYKTNVEIKQRKKQGIYVLDHNDYPSILIECGYMDNPGDLAFISDKTNQEKIARAILKALTQFANHSATKAILTTDQYQDTIIYRKLNPPEKKIPSTELLKNWADSKLYGVWIDNKRIANNDLNKYKSNDFSHYNISKLTKTAINYGKHYYQIDLMTNKFYEKLIKEWDPNKMLKVIFSTDTVPNKKGVYEKVEIAPSFPGGDMAWRRYLEKNLQGFNPSKNGAPKGAYTIYVQFVVDENGNVSDVIPLTKHGYEMEKKAIEVIKKGPKWIPAIQNGKTVKAYKKQPVTFEIIGKDKTSIIPYPTIKDKTNAEKEVVVVQPEVDNKEKNINENKVFEKVEIEPSFPGGKEAWQRYLQKVLGSFNPADSGATEGNYTVVVQFIVHEDGFISDIKTLTHFGYGMEDKVIELIKKGPKWVPAIQNGHNVTAYKKQPVTFQIAEE